MDDEVQAASDQVRSCGSQEALALNGMVSLAQKLYILHGVETSDG